MQKSCMDMHFSTARARTAPAENIQLCVGSLHICIIPSNLLTFMYEQESYDSGAAQFGIQHYAKISQHCFKSYSNYFLCQKLQTSETEKNSFSKKFGSQSEPFCFKTSCYLLDCKKEDNVSVVKSLKVRDYMHYLRSGPRFRFSANLETSDAKWTRSEANWMYLDLSTHIFRKPENCFLHIKSYPAYSHSLLWMLGFPSTRLKNISWVGNRHHLHFPTLTLWVTFLSLLNSLLFQHLFICLYLSFYIIYCFIVKSKTPDLEVAPG